MAALIVGSTLSDLGRNSLIEEEGRRQDFQNALALMAQRRNMGEEFALRREMAALENSQRGADMAMRERVAMAPWDRGITPAEGAKNQLLGREIDERSTFNNAKLAQDRLASMLPYLLPTRAQAAQIDIEQQKLPSLNALYEAQAKYMLNGGQTQWQLQKADADRKAEEEMLRSASAAAAANANAALRGSLAANSGTIAKALDAGEWYNWGRGGGEATDIANQLLQPGATNALVGGRSVIGDPDVAAQYRTVRNQLIPQAAQSVLSSLGQDAALIQFDHQSGSFVPAFARPPMAAATNQAPAQAPAPVARFVKGPDGRYALAGGAPSPVSLPTAPTAAPAQNQLLGPEYGPTQDPTVLAAQLEQEISRMAASGRGDIGGRLRDEVARALEMRPYTTRSPIGSSAFSWSSTTSPRAMINADPAKYDRWLASLPPEERVAIYLRALGKQ